MPYPVGKQPSYLYPFFYLYYAGTDKPAVNPGTYWLSSTGYEDYVEVSFGSWLSSSAVSGYFWRISFVLHSTSSPPLPSVPVTLLLEIRMSGVAVGCVSVLLD
jgi:hypothetical protein